MLKFFFRSLIWRTLLPVICIGFIFAFSLSSLLIPPIITIIKERANKELTHTTFLAMNICEERLRDILDLRLEESLEMNRASKKEAMQEIVKVAKIFPNIRIMVLDRSGNIQGASFQFQEGENPDKQLFETILQQNHKNSHIHNGTFNGKPMQFSHGYFPFWRWHIISFIPNEEFLAPIHMTKRVITLGTFGTFFAVILSIAFFFLFFINRPLKKIISATEDVRKGNFKQIKLTGHGEIEHVASAFDEMVQKLEYEQKQIEQILKELSESEEQYRVLFDNSLALVFMLKNNRFLFANQAAGRFFSVPPEELQNKSIFSFFNEYESKLFDHKIQNLENHYSTVEHFEISFSPDTPQERWLEMIASTIPYKGERTIIIHAIEITKRKIMKRDQKEMRKKLERSERMEVLGTLAGGVAHDLNNILGGIVGYPELLMQGIDKNDKIYKSLEIIKNSGMRAAAIVQDLLTLTRRGVFVTEIVNLGEIINDYLDSPEFQNLCAHHPEITIEKNISSDLFNILGSRVHLSKTIMNLVANAAEAITDEGKIEIFVQNCYVDKPIGHYEEIVEGEYVLINVSDSGKGIDEKDLVRIFEPFYTKKVMGRSGTGLGMSVVWGTVKDHNGYIEVLSTVNVGTTFKLYFPVTRKEIEKATDPFALENYMGNGQKVLVIDDIEEQRLIATSMLEQLGYKVKAANCGEDAIKLLKKEKYDLLLIDMIMEPHMDGLQTYKKAKKLRSDQKAVIASGFSETERVKKALAIGAGAYIKKPYTLETIAKILREQFEEVA